MKQVLAMLVQVVLIGVMAMLLMFYLAGTIEPVSRREANAPYVLFMVSFITVQILIELVYFVLYQIIFVTKAFDRAAGTTFETFQRRYQSRIFEVVGRNGLIMFLYANVLTGAINFGVDTLAVSDPHALIILFIYAAILVAFGFGYDWAVRGRTLAKTVKTN